MEDGLGAILDNLLFILQRLDLVSVIDLGLVTLIFFLTLRLLRDTHAMVLLRGVLLVVVLGSMLRSFQVLPAFSWLVQTTLPVLLLAVPVIFAPEIRRALEQLGRAGQFNPAQGQESDTLQVVPALVTAATRLSDRRHGALIVVERNDSLQEYVRTGVNLDARITPELLLQVFYPNTPLHDGAAILKGTRLVAAACVMPLSASGVLTRSPERQMGLRHRAALGISEVSDAVVLVVSEETGSVPIVHGGRMIRRLDAERLENILRSFFRPAKSGRSWLDFWQRFIRPTSRSREENP